MQTSNTSNWKKRWEEKKKKKAATIWFDHSSFLSLEIENENRLME